MTSTTALPTPLVSTQWLADHLGFDDLVIVDATVLMVAGPRGSTAFASGDEEYLVHGHVPGAVFADLLEVFSDPDGRHGFTKPSAEQFEAAAESVGVDNDTTLVVYDNSVGHWAARIWWLFRAFGHERVVVLDGGLKKWVAENRPIDTGYVAPRVVDGFIAVPQPGVWVDKDFVSSIVAGDTDATLICGVPPREFTGEVSHRPRAGHIPGSISAPAGRLVDRETNAFLPTSTLHTIFADATASDAPIVAYCGGGVAAASDALALSLIGRTDVVLYDGSLNEWAADESAVLATVL